MSAFGFKVGIAGGYYWPSPEDVVDASHEAGRPMTRKDARAFVEANYGDASDALLDAQHDAMSEDECRALALDWLRATLREGS